MVEYSPSRMYLDDVLVVVRYALAELMLSPMHNSAEIGSFETAGSKNFYSTYRSPIVAAQDPTAGSRLTSLFCSKRVQAPRTSEACGETRSRGFPSPPRSLSLSLARSFARSRSLFNRTAGLQHTPPVAMLGLSGKDWTCKLVQHELLPLSLHS